MKRILLLFFIAILTCNVFSQQLPLDPQVRVGQLQNGMTYYLMHNEWPKDRVTFFLTQRIGSVQEEESQLGLAHFLEHMCFNGSKHFPNNTSDIFIKSHGFDNNAATQLDKTVYYINNVPLSVGESVLDSCLLLLQDWAHGLTLDSKEINAERDVIHGEYRYRIMGEGQLLYDEMHRLYPGRYGQRHPIGTMQVVDNFEHQELIDFYHKWYNPQNQAVIIVGDIDIDNYERKVNQMFGSITSELNAGEWTEYAIDDNDAPIFSVAHNKDLSSSKVIVSYKLPNFPREFFNSIDFQLLQYVMDAACSVLEYRMSDWRTKEGCPWFVATASMGNDLTERHLHLNLEAQPREGQSVASYGLLLTELRRLLEYGITETEYQQFLLDKNNDITSLQNQIQQRESKNICSLLSNHFAYGQPVLNPEMTIGLLQQMMSQLTVERVNDLLTQMVHTDGHNLIIRCWEKEFDGATYTTEEALRQMTAAVQNATIEAPVTDNNIRPMLTEMPVAGKIINEEAAPFGFKHLTLSNGANVYLRHSEVERGQVELQAWANAGTQQFDTEEFCNFSMLNNVPYGLDGIGINEMRKVKAGHQVSGGMKVSPNLHILEFQSSTKDVEMMLQMATLFFGKITRDDDIFPLAINNLADVIGNYEHNFDQVYSRQLNEVFNAHNVRYAMPTLDDLKHVDYDRIISMLSLPLSNAANFVFMINGDYEEDSIRSFIELYLASLPSKGQPDQFRQIEEPKLTERTVSEFTFPMTEPKVMSDTRWINYRMSVTPQNELMLIIASNILGNRYDKRLREEMGACYTPSCQFSIDYFQGSQKMTLQAVHTGFKPELADEAIAYTWQSIRDLAATPCSEEELATAKEMLLSEFHQIEATSLKFYSDALFSYLSFNGYNRYSIFDTFVPSITPTSLQACLQEFLRDAVEAQVVARPE